MITNGITSASGTTTGTPANQRTAGSTMDKDAFMRLMVETLRHQDPTAPADGKEFFAQMSQMTMMEQITTLATSAADSAKEAKVARATALVGRTVTWPAADGTSRTGLVESVDLSGTSPKLTVAGEPGVDPALLTEVK